MLSVKWWGLVMKRRLVGLITALSVIVGFQMAVHSLSSELTNPAETCLVGLALTWHLWPSQIAWEVVMAIVPFPHPTIVVLWHLVALGHQGVWGAGTVVLVYVVWRVPCPPSVALSCVGGAHVL